MTAHKREEGRCSRGAASERLKLIWIRIPGYRVYRCLKSMGLSSTRGGLLI